MITFLNKTELVFFVHKWFHLISNNSVYCKDSLVYTVSHWFKYSFLFTQLNVKTVLFLTIQFSMSTKLNGSEYCYVSVTIQLTIRHLFSHS